MSILTNLRFQFFFLVERSQNSYTDVKFDGELISDVFIKFQNGLVYEKHKTQEKTSKYHAFFKNVTKDFLIGSFLIGSGSYKEIIGKMMKVVDFL